MELSDENTNKLYRNTIRYLYDVTEQIPDNLNILKSYYASKFRISELQTKIFVERNKNKTESRCPRCCLKLIHSDSRCVVKAEAKKTKFARKVLKKRASNKVLTKFQHKYVKQGDFNSGNSLVVTCNFCEKDVSFNCPKSVKVRPKPVKPKKKPKKKKDKFCGLQKEAVTATTQKKQLSIFNNIENSQRTDRNPILKQKRKEQNRLKTLSKMFNGKKTKPKNQLMSFLESLK